MSNITNLNYTFNRKCRGWVLKVQFANLNGVVVQYMATST